MNKTTFDATGASLIDRMAALPEAQRRALLDELPDEVCAQALYAWEFWARSDQLPPPGEWRVWLLRSGRGAGKLVHKPGCHT